MEDITKRLNPDDALEFLLRSKMPSKSGTSSDRASHPDVDYACEAKSLWST
jgi:hypothetical protein